MEEDVMSLLRDLVITARDAIRLGDDLLRYKVQSKTRTVKRGVLRLAICLGVGLVVLGFVGGGIGLLIYGSFAMVANELGFGPAGLIIGAACMLFAGFLVLLSCGGRGRS
jgi:hypothetical protein